MINLHHDHPRMLKQDRNTTHIHRITENTVRKHTVRKERRKPMPETY